MGALTGGVLSPIGAVGEPRQPPQGPSQEGHEAIPGAPGTQRCPRRRKHLQARPRLALGRLRSKSRPIRVSRPLHRWTRARSKKRPRPGALALRRAPDPRARRRGPPVRPPGRAILYATDLAARGDRGRAVKTELDADSWAELEGSMAPLSEEAAKRSAPLAVPQPPPESEFAQRVSEAAEAALDLDTRVNTTS
jgi:hypothetical protein